MRVFARYAGERMCDYLQKNQRQAPEVEKQSKEIFKRLEKIGIENRHPHLGNFVVERVNGKLMVSVIDFSLAHRIQIERKRV